MRATRIADIRKRGAVEKLCAEPGEEIDPILFGTRDPRARARGRGSGRAYPRADSDGGLPRTPCTYEVGRAAGEHFRHSRVLVDGAMHVDVRVATSDPPCR